MLGRFMPARLQAIQAPESVRVVVDLDRLISEPVGFKWKGRVHSIRPMTNEQFLKSTNDISKLQWLARQESVDHKAIMHGYAKIFSTCCGTISVEDVYEMTQSQMAALFQQIHDIITGKAFADEKKNPNVPTEDQSKTQKSMPQS